MAHDSSPLPGGILDLDEPEDGAEIRHADPRPPSDWSDDEPLIIDVDGNVHIRGGRFFASRVVGSVRGKDGQVVIADLVARFQALQDRFASLHQEIRGSRNLVRSLKSMRSFAHWVEGADAIGDFAGLLERVHAVLRRLEAKVEGNRSARLNLTERAEALAESTRWKTTGETMNELMDEWKKARPVGGEEDDALWQRFRSARQTFFSRRSAHFAELKRSWRSARGAKEALIVRAQELASSRDWAPTFAAMQVLMDEWKQAGSVGRRDDEELWQEFRAARDPFFVARRDEQARQRSRQSERRKDRGGPRRGRREGGPDLARSGGVGRGRHSGTLHASLAEIAGPLEELLAAVKKRDEAKKKG